MVDYSKNKKNAPLPQTQWKDKRLIVILTNPNEIFTPVLMRKQINNAFKNANVNVTVATIAKTITESNNIIIKTLNNNSVNDLIKHQHIWKPIVKPAKIAKNKTWHKILAHGVNTRFAMDMHALKLDIEKYNSGVKLTNDFKWIFVMHLKKSFSSIILNIIDENGLQIVLHRLNVNANWIITTKFHFKTFMQCTKCQQFKHENMTCKNTPNCRIYSKNHETKTHKYDGCNETKACVHTSAKCSNCHGNHETNNHVCEIIKALKSKSQTNPNELWIQCAKFSKLKICTT